METGVIGGYNIKTGPSREDLFDSLKRDVPPRQLKVSFIVNPIMQPDRELRIEGVIDELKRTMPARSDHHWLIGGYCTYLKLNFTVNLKTYRVTLSGAYDSESREGKITLYAMADFDAIERLQMQISKDDEARKRTEERTKESLRDSVEDLVDIMAD